MEVSRLGDSRGLKALVLLDTNFLLAIAKGEVGVESILDAVGLSFELATTSSVVDELTVMASQGDRLAREAVLALGLLGRMEVKVLEASGGADESLLRAAVKAKEEGRAVFVATNDRGLRRRLRNAGVPSIYIRENGRLVRAEWDYL